jgi:glycosyltransferase involved in cell wall biosynthesis
MATPLSIGIVTPTLSRSGGGIFPIVRAHAKGLHASPDARVTLYGLRDALSDDDIATLLPVVPRAYTPVMARVGYAPQLAADLLAANHDVVHQHGLWMYPSIAVSRWRRAHGRPTVISTQGMLEPWAVSNAAFKKRIAAMLFERSNLSHASCIHCSEAEVAGVRAFGLANPIAVIPNGVELPDPAAPPPPRPHWLPQGRHAILFLGRLHPKKGLAELLRAWSLLVRRNPNAAGEWSLAIAGWDDGGFEAGLRSLASELGLAPPQVIFTGALFGEAKTAAFAHAEALVLPSHSEGFPMTVLEAWAHGLAVLMTRASNVPAGFEANAALEITTDSGEMAAALEAALFHADLRALGANGRRLAQKNYSWDAIVADLLALYAWLGGRASAPSFVRMD